ncbi:MAG TPA: NADH:ubiquinone reductase (Na(+)-transporting) subunit C [Cyclobacteriaceae bacterium]|nr:NADH:ubiquinone reductase (Na(+)-transporting) subunit C [Cyclobacteriaceae bacterium]
MQQSNGYIIGFILVLCVLIGGLLAGTSIVLGPAQQQSLELDTKHQILAAVSSLVEVPEKGTDILALYDRRISSTVVNYDGEIVTQDADDKPVVAEEVNIAGNYKLDPKERLYPVFRLVDENDTSKVEAYILPVYGNGLWDRIWGYVALGPTVETIVGTSFDHKAETPGLGQRIATPEIQNRFVGKKIFDEDGKLVSVMMMKGEHGGGEASVSYYEDEPHMVDGMSGATLTANGVNAMMKSYLLGYRNFFKKIKGAATQSTAAAGK